MGLETHYFSVLPEILRTGKTEDKRYRQHINPDYGRVKRQGSSLNLWWLGALCWLLDDWSYKIGGTHARQAIARALRDDLEGYFGGAELLSRVKWGWVCHCVTKVLDVAIEHNMNTLEDLARQWLTTAHALHALCALPESYEEWRTGPSIHNCGPRSPASHWGSQPLDDLFAAHIGAEHSIKPNFAAESPNAERVWQYLLVESCEHLEKHLDGEFRWLFSEITRQGKNIDVQIEVLIRMPAIRSAAEYHFFRWPDRVLTLYGNGRNPHSAPLLAREMIAANPDAQPINVPPTRAHGRSYPRYSLSINEGMATWLAPKGEGRGYAVPFARPLYHVILDGQGIRRVA